MIRTDFILNSDGDFPLQDTYINGVIQETPYGFSDTQHCIDLVADPLGATKELPNIAFYVKQYLKAIVTPGIYNSLKSVLSFDGYSSSSQLIKSVNGGGFFINFEYISPNY